MFKPPSARKFQHNSSLKIQNTSRFQSSRKTLCVVIFSTNRLFTFCGKFCHSLYVVSALKKRSENIDKAPLAVGVSFRVEAHDEWGEDLLLFNSRPHSSRFFVRPAAPKPTPLAISRLVVFMANARKRNFVWPLWLKFGKFGPFGEGDEFGEWAEVLISS
jgi:hypothetical protein